MKSLRLFKKITVILSVSLGLLATGCSNYLGTNEINAPASEENVLSEKENATATTEQTIMISEESDDGDHDSDSDTEKEESWEDGYSIVLNAYREEYVKEGIYWDSFDEIPKIPNVENSIIEMEFYSSFRPFSFLLHDLDNNGIPELFICRYYESDNNGDSGVIYHVFTWSEGKTIELLDNLGYRNGICTICQDNLLKVDSSGTGTDYGSSIFYLPRDGVELEKVEEFYAVQNKDDTSKSDFFYYSDGSKTPITEEQLLQYEQGYTQQSGIRLIAGTKDNIDHLEEIWDGNYFKSETVSTINEDELDSQIQLFIDNKDLWIITYEDGAYTSPNTVYYLTDYDHNGRLELTGYDTQGTGIYSTEQVYEVNAAHDGLDLVGNSLDAAEYDAEITSYYDETDQSYRYIATNHTKSGAYWGKNIKYSIRLQDGLLKYSLIAIEEYEPVQEGSTDLKFTYTDSQGINITEAQYDKAEENLYSDLEQQTIRQGCIMSFDDKEFVKLSDEKMKELMIKSYEMFSGKISYDDFHQVNEDILGN